MRRSSRSIATVALIAISVSCDRQTIATDFSTEAPPPIAAPNFAIVDGANGGIRGFYFVPPTVAATPSFSGVFDATLVAQLRVEVCRLNSAGVCEVPPVAILTSVAADARNAIRVNTERQFYSVYWYTGVLPQTGRTYRATVMLNGVGVGYIDIAEPKPTSWRLIAFRVEQGINPGNAAPVVTINSPATGTTVNEGSGLNFGATAADSEDGDVSASIIWSSNLQGALGNGPSLNNVVLTAGTHIITAQATDSQGVTDTASITITVSPNAPPVVTITAPANNAQFELATPVTFTATAQDPEDGNVATSLTWSSDVSGALGNGASITASNLAPGPHTVTATATDSRGRTTSATITITITNTNAPPAITITAPADGSLHQAGTPVTFQATASDPEDGNLATAIQWSSNLQGAIGSGSTITANLNGGTHTITASVTDAGNLTATASITVVVSIITMPPTLNVPFGGTASLPVTLSEPAPAGGLVLAITTSHPGAVGLQTTTITIPAGQQAANATLIGVTPGVSTVTASNPTYGSDASQVSTTANINIVASAVSFAFNVTQQLTIQLESNGAGIAAPAGGITVDLTAGNPQCVANQQVTIPAGLVSVNADLAYGGTASLPCTTAVTASAPGISAISTDNVNATVNPAAPINIGNLSTLRLGSGLQFGSFSITLGAVAPAGGVAITMQSSDANVLRASPNAGTAGTGTLVLNVPAGQTGASFYLQGIEGQTGQPTLTFSAPGYQNATVTIQVVPVAADIIGLNATTTSLSVNDMFQVRVGAINATNNGLYAEQEVRAGGAPIAFGVTNSNAAVGQLVTTAVTGQAATVTVPVGVARSPLTLAAGAIEFDPLGTGATTVSISNASVVLLAGATQTVTVSGPAITAPLSAIRVGSGLQYGSFNFTLGAAAPAGGLPVTLQSSDGNLLRVSPNAGTAGVATLIVNVAAGQSAGSFYVQGMENATGSPTITFSAPGFTSSSTTVQVVPPAMEIIALSTSTTTLSPNDLFQVHVGAINSTNNALFAEQEVRAGGTPIVFNVTNSNASVGQLVTTAATGQAVTVTVPTGSARSALTLAAGGIEFDPLVSGTTNVTASNATVTSLAGAIQTINVTAPPITANLSSVRVGSGLQHGSFAISLGAPAPAGGLAVTLQSSDANLLRVSPNATTAGTATLVINIPAGQNGASFFVHGMENATGPATITFSAPAYASSSTTLQVVPVAMDIIGLNTTTTTLSPNDPFQIRVGAISTTNNGLYAEQAVRVGGIPIAFSVTSSNAGAGQLATSALTGQTVTVTVPIGAARTPTALASGGIEFDPLGVGTSSVTASNANVTSLAGATQTVNVTTPTISTNLPGVRVGSGLQSGSHGLTLGAPAPAGGLAVTITSSAGAVLLLSPNSTTAGSVSIVVNVPAGQTLGSFWLQGMENQTGAATLTFSAAGFTNGTATVNVVPVAVDFISLATSIGAGAANDPFQARIGAVSSTNNGLYAEQAVRAGGTGLTINLSNSNATVARLVFSSGPAQAGSVVIPVGSARSAATVAGGGVELDPLASGSSLVTAFGSGIVTVPAGSVTIQVN